MKKIMHLIFVLSLSLLAILPAHAKNDEVMLPIDEALNAKDAQEKLGDSVKFYFGTQKHPKVLKKLGIDSTNQTTSGFGRSAEKACNLVFLSAMLKMQRRAEQLGANAIINIVSYYGKKEKSSNTEFECHKGGVVAVVALKGEFVKIAGK
jgi:uncharacterized protein YbjQ (UPF0145 family)